ncbi:hypothetical protein IFM89_020667 [Coptis chinensis]|uniref:AT hook motif-containing protein n=1 Tax=Coptis chinensis TaxID=261450 RepID=A0A835GXG6_9MAGN|nr:hypothetical protein IFM89_020667 [Coptis chinensis]
MVRAHLKNQPNRQGKHYEALKGFGKKTVKIGYSKYFFLLENERRESSDRSCFGAKPACKTETGRPRKDENLRRVEKSPVVTPKPDTAKKNPPKNISSTSNGDYAMVGQAVSGVLDGSFEAGYLITVKVGDTNTFLRGVVFEPGFVVPISEANDVASNVKMIKRNEIPVDLSVASVDQVSKVAELSSSPVQSSPTMSSKGAPFDMNQIPQALRQAVSRIVHSPHIHHGEQANEGSQVIQLPSQSLDALPKDKTQTPLKGGHDNLNQAELLQGSGISCLKGAANGDETKDLKLELTPGTSIEIFPDNGTIATVSEAPGCRARTENRWDIEWPTCLPQRQPCRC